MDPWVFALVLLAALLHAVWNTLVKTAGDPLVGMSLLDGMCAVLGLVLLPFVGFPNPEAWPYLAGSAFLHCTYMLLLVQSYKHGELSLVYPLARGSAPLLAAAGAWTFAREELSAWSFGAVLIISAGILLLATYRGKSTAAAVILSLSTGAMIAGYTVVDGIGVREALDLREIVAYVVWLVFFTAPAFALLTLALRRDAWRQTVRREWRRSVAGGSLAFAAYAIALWAMTHAPIASVAALREVSVVLAAWIGTRMLRERGGRTRILAAALVVAGAVVLRLA